MARVQIVWDIRRIINNMNGYVCIYEMPSIKHLYM